MPIVLTPNGLSQLSGKPNVAFLELSDTAASSADQMGINYTGAASSPPTGYTLFQALSTISAANNASSATVPGNVGFIGVVKGSTTTGTGNSLLLPIKSIASGSWVFSIKVSSTGALGPTVRISARAYQVNASLGTATAITSFVETTGITSAGTYTITMNPGAVTFAGSTPYLYIEFQLHVTTGGTNLTPNLITIDTISATIPAVSYAVTVSDPTGTSASDAISRSLVLARAPSETITSSSDGVSRHGAYARTLPESLSASSDAITRIYSRVVAVSESISAASDAITRSQATGRGVSESLSSAVDTVLRGYRRVVVVLDTTAQRAFDTASILINNGIGPDAQYLADDINSLYGDNLVEMYELDLTPIGGDIAYFHAGVNKLRGPVVWQGRSYSLFAVHAEGFEYNGGGQFPRPKISVANTDGTITALILTYYDLLGAKVTRRRTFAKYLDAVNFESGVNPTADPSQAFPDEIWFIARKASEDKAAVVFELAAASDLAGVRLPSRQVTANRCGWIYKSSECSWVPGPLFDINGNPTSDPALDACSHLLSSGCKVRFGESNPLPFGAFPGAGTARST